MPLAQLNKIYEPLAEAVRGYECLYNKSHRDFKDECQKNRAWIKIASDLDEHFQDVGEVKKTWESLKKLLYRRQAAYVSANKSGTDPEAPEL